MPAHLPLIRTELSDGSRGPTAFAGNVRPIDCVAFLDGTIEDAKRLFKPERLPQQFGRGRWRADALRAHLSENGSVYRVEFTKGADRYALYEAKLDIAIVPKLATCVLQTFRFDG